jgi:hypothetical protein
MTDQEIQELIHSEFTQKILGVTEQYLEIHEPVYENNLPKIVRIDRDNGDPVVAYVPVKGEHFLFAVFLNEEDGSIYSINTLSRNKVSFIVTSNSWSSNRLAALTKLKVRESWNQGDYRFKNNTTAMYKSSGIAIEPNPEPGEFENKLKMLLHYLYEDAEGVLALLKYASGSVDVVMDFHHGNQHIGSAFIDQECINIMNELNLEISFDLWAWGNPFK